MTVTCSRCGRPRAVDEPTWPGVAVGRLSDEADSEGRVLREGAWAQLDGAFVCPRCLTVDEERALARSLVEMVEAEVARLQESGEAPEAHESPLIAYALVLRSRLEGVSGDESTPPPPR